MKQLPHLTAAFAASAMLSLVTAHAQSYPARAARIVIPQGPGGGNDSIARMVAQKLSTALKQQFVADNRPGAGGLIAAELVVKSPPDGYTLLLASTAAMTIIPHAQKTPPYDPTKDFAAISLVAVAPLLVVVHPSLPVHSIRELIALAKARPGQLNYASNGVGTTAHLAAEIFDMMTGVKMVHVPYKGFAPATTDLISGQVQVMFAGAVAAMPQAKAGRLRAIAMTGTKRWPVAPDLPTVAESGLPDYAAEGWYGIAAPAGTPRAIIDLLSREIAAAAKAPDVADRLSVEGVIAVGSTPEEFAAYIKKDYDRVGKVVKVSKIKFD